MSIRMMRNLRESCSSAESKPSGRATKSKVNEGELGYEGRSLVGSVISVSGYQRDSNARHREELADDERE